MNHKTYKPHVDLSSLVKCYWNLEIQKNASPEKNTIIPDGCIKMIFHYGDEYKHHSDSGEITILPKCLVVGQLTRPYIVEPTGETGTFFVCFHPNGFSPFASVALKELENKVMSMENLFGKTGNDISNKILNANSTSERIQVIEAFLLNSLVNTESIDNIVQTTVETILTLNGQLKIDVLSKQNNINRRQLARKFSSDIGLSPKQLSKTIRLQSALKMLLTEDVNSLTNLAYENEYYDQAHFIKDFKEFTGLTPKEFYRDNLKMSLIFDTPK